MAQHSRFEFTPEILEEETNQPIEGAEVTGTFWALDGEAPDAKLIPARTGPDGKVKINAVNITVTKDGYEPYVEQPYRRPSLDAPIRVHLRRL